MCKISPIDVNIFLAHQGDYKHDVLQSTVLQGNKYKVT